MEELIKEMEQTLYEMEMDGDCESPRYFKLCDQLDRLYQEGAEIYGL